MELALFLTACFVFFGGAGVRFLLEGDYAAAVFGLTLAAAAPWTYWMVS